MREFNKEVIRYRKEASITTEQKVLEGIWKEEHKHLDPEAYNLAVLKYNQKNGPQLRQKNLKQPVKKDSEKFVQLFLLKEVLLVLIFYICQLKLLF